MRITAAVREFRGWRYWREQGWFPEPLALDDNERLAFGDFQVEGWTARPGRAVADDETFVQTADGNHRWHGSHLGAARYSAAPLPEEGSQG